MFLFLFKCISSFIMENNNKYTKPTLLVAGFGICCLIIHQKGRIIQKLRKLFDNKNPLRQRKISLIETQDECQRIVKLLKNECKDYKVLGFDCEWITAQGKQQPVALLQLSSHKGLCALFRLCVLKCIPNDLREILEDKDLIKVGVAAYEDSQKITTNYNIKVESTFDLRYLAFITGHQPGGLSRLSQEHLNYKLNKDWRISCSDWEAKFLSERQITYAADDALVAVAIFKKLSYEMEPPKFFENAADNLAKVVKIINPLMNCKFHNRNVASPPKTDRAKKEKCNQLKKQENELIKTKQSNRGMCTKAKVYEDCFLHAPDGELLSIIDRNKLQWYLNQNLATMTCADPLTIRLNFEPSGRAKGDFGRYYQTPKRNLCVVCGSSSNFIRKNVVPREYRKHFPNVMKSHTSHDVLLLCPNCHRQSEFFDTKKRQELALKCDAPLASDRKNPKFFLDFEMQKVQKYARALLTSQSTIPTPKADEMRSLILKYFTDEKEVTTGLLEKVADIDVKKANVHFFQHGKLVVNKYCTEFGGVIELVKLWRQHFLDSMHPKFLPELWSVNHGIDKLELYAIEDRITNEDLIKAGLIQTYQSKSA